MRDGYFGINHFFNVRQKTRNTKIRLHKNAEVVLQEAIERYLYITFLITKKKKKCAIFFGLYVIFE